MPTISIIIPAYNAQKTIAQTIRAALSQDCEQDLEVIVVDDGSTDSTAQIVRLFPQVSYFYQANSGPAAARNFGVQKSQGEFVFFTDSDCIPHPNWVRRILPHFADPQVAAVAGSYGIANPRSHLANGIYQEIIYRHSKGLRKCANAFGSYNVALRRKVFDAVRGYDPLYRKASGEDNDLSYKILKAGYKIVFEPQAKVDHYHPTKVRKYLFEQFQHGFWRAKMYFDHPQMMRGDGYTFWKDALEIPMAFLTLALSLFMFLGFSGSLVLWFAGALFLIEIYFSFCMIGLSVSSLYFGVVMFLRSFARTVGFGCGFFRFLPRKLLGK